MSKWDFIAFRYSQHYMHVHIQDTLSYVIYILTLLDKVSALNNSHNKTLWDAHGRLIVALGSWTEGVCEPRKKTKQQILSLLCICHANRGFLIAPDCSLECLRCFLFRFHSSSPLHQRAPCVIFSFHVLPCFFLCCSQRKCFGADWQGLNLNPGHPFTIVLLCYIIFALFVFVIKLVASCSTYMISFINDPLTKRASGERSEVN